MSQAIGPGEVWAPICDTDGLYEVSTEGRVRRTQVMRHGTLPALGIVACRPNNHGYPMFNTTIAGRSFNKALHLVVLMAFRGPRPDGLHGAHLNGQKLDARLDNLAYVTPSENNQHKVAHGTAQRGERSGRAKLTAAQVLEIRSSPERNIDIANRLGLNRHHVSDLRRGASWRHLNNVPAEPEQVTA